MRILSCLLIALSFGLAAVHSAKAVVVSSVESDVAPEGGAAHDPFTPSYASGSPSGVDLLEGYLPSDRTGNFEIEETAGPFALTDGSDSTVYPEGGTGGDAIDHAAYAAGGPNAGTSLTYELGGIFDLSSIVVYGGWNDGGRDAQSYEIFTSADGGASFTSLATFNNDPGESGTTPIGWRVEFTENAAPNLADSVSHLRFDFGSVENGYTGYAEIDVFGQQLFLPGDANRDGVVDLDDFYLISDNFFTVPSAGGLDGDIVPNNFVDAADFRLWKDSAPAEVLAQFYALSAAPEPSSLLLMTCCLAAMASGPKRRRFR